MLVALGLGMVVTFMALIIMIDLGLFDPVVRLAIRMVGQDPARIVVGTAVLAMIVSLRCR